MNDTHNPTLHLNAISIGTTANTRLTQHEMGRVHSVFQQVINISVHDNLISIVGKRVGQGPLNIVVNFPHDLDLTAIVKAGDIVTLDETIRIDNTLSITTNSTSIWEASINFQDLLHPVNVILSNIEVVKEVVLASKNLKGLGELIDHVNDMEISSTYQLEPISKFAVPHISSLIRAIRLRISHDIIQSSNKIIGLGSGLTPSGDDMLIGLMISMIYISENVQGIDLDVEKISSDIISDITGRTTIISEEFLREAACGRVNEPVATLMEKILISGQKEMRESAKKVLSVGSTSGADTIFGIILGTNLMLT